MIVPYNTDAPIYHWPIATVSLIVVNTVVFFFTTFQVMVGTIPEESIYWLTVEFSVINPLQWLTGAFMHADPIHLIGNMIFLWTFGLIVEGKLGAGPFLLVYLLITVLWGFFVQVPMFLLGSEELALGASGTIFGLLVLAVIWAPENEMDCFYWFFLSIGTFEVRIISLGAFYIAIQVLFWFLGGFQMSSELLHLIGIVVAVPIGFGMLRADLVDCEGWDVVSRNEWLQGYNLFISEKQRQRLKQKEEAVYDPVTAAIGYTRPIPKQPTGPKSYLDQQREAREGGDVQTAPREQDLRSPLEKLTSFFEPERVKQQQSQEQSRPPGPPPQQHPEFNRLAFMFRQTVESGSTLAAMQTFQRMDQMSLATGLADNTLLRYATLLGRDRRYLEAMRPLTIMAEHDGELADDARLRIARIQLSVLGQPTQALKTLQKIEDDHSSQQAAQRTQHKLQMASAAQQAIGRGG